MTGQEITHELTGTPDESQRMVRDVVRVARVRMTWSNAIGEWVFDPPHGVSTYYTEREPFLETAK